MSVLYYSNYMLCFSLYLNPQRLVSKYRDCLTDCQPLTEKAFKRVIWAFLAQAVSFARSSLWTVRFNVGGGQLAFVNCQFWAICGQNYDFCAFHILYTSLSGQYKFYLIRTSLWSILKKLSFRNIKIKTFYSKRCLILQSNFAMITLFSIWEIYPYN